MLLSQRLVYTFQVWTNFLTSSSILVFHLFAHQAIWVKSFTPPRFFTFRMVPCSFAPQIFVDQSIAAPESISCTARLYRTQISLTGDYFQHISLHGKRMYCCTNCCHFYVCIHNVVCPHPEVPLRSHEPFSVDRRSMLLAESFSINFFTKETFAWSLHLSKKLIR